jgi:hypothetical protein
MGNIYIVSSTSFCWTSYLAALTAYKSMDYLLPLFSYFTLSDYATLSSLIALVAGVIQVD